MGLFDAIGGFLGVPGPSQILGGGGGGGGGGPIVPDNNPGLIAQANASRDAAITQSNNGVIVAQTNAATMQLGILQSSQQAQFQTLAWLTERLDANDTKMQIAVENAKLQFQQQSDKHVENMEGLKNDARELDIRAAEMEKAGENDGIATAGFAA